MTKKRCALVIILMLLLAVPANALSLRANTCYAELSFTGTTAECYAFITAGSDDEISATMKLWDGSRCIATWSDTGTGFLILSEEKSVTKGKSYELTVDYSIDGVTKTQVKEEGTCK